MNETETIAAVARPVVPNDFELLGVAHFYRLPLLGVMAMSHSPKPAVQDALRRLVDHLPPRSISDAVAAAVKVDDPRSLLRIETLTWESTFRLLNELRGGRAGTRLTRKGGGRG